MCVITLYFLKSAISVGRCIVCTLNSLQNLENILAALYCAHNNILELILVNIAFLTYYAILGSIL